MNPLRKRVIILVADSVGVGEMSDAAKYDDKGASTLSNVAKHVGGLSMPNMQEMGLGNIVPVMGVPSKSNPTASFGRMAETSNAKDTTTGHWELAGLPLEESWSFFPKGFPAQIIDPFVQKAGLDGVLGNKAASGTEIIDQLGAEHVRTGKPIVYTSADSVVQLAAHESVIPVDQLYRICNVARELLDQHRVARVIARPFIGDLESGYKRTYNRHDFSMEPPGPTVLDILAEAGYPVVGVGKIQDIFAGKGVTQSHHTEGNLDGLETTARVLDEVKKGLVFVNLVDFDMLYGHRNNPTGYAQALEEMDLHLPKVLGKLDADDLLIITADHGCDPTLTHHTDHTREHVPLLVFNPGKQPGVDLGTRSSFSDVGATVAQALGVKAPAHGTSFLKEVI